MNDNDQRMRELLDSTMPDLLIIKDLMDEYEILPYDVMQALYLIGNIMKISKYGKVSFKIKDSRIISINQEQTLVTERELRQNLEELRKKKQNMV